VFIIVKNCFIYNSSIIQKKIASHVRWYIVFGCPHAILISLMMHNSKENSKENAGVSEYQFAKAPRHNSKENSKLGTPALSIFLSRPLSHNSKENSKLKEVLAAYGLLAKEPKHNSKENSKCVALLELFVYNSLQPA